MIHALLGLLFVATIGVVIMLLAEKRRMITYIGFSILFVPYILMFLDMLGVL